MKVKNLAVYISHEWNQRYDIIYRPFLPSTSIKQVSIWYGMITVIKMQN